MVLVVVIEVVLAAAELKAVVMIDTGNVLLLFFVSPFTPPSLFIHILIWTTTVLGIL